MMARRRTLEGGAAASGGTGHIPVLLSEVIDHLNLQSGGLYVDATFGAGGYTRAMLEAADIRVMAIDRDPNAGNRADELIAKFGDRLVFCNGRFGEMAELVRGQGIEHVDGVVFDIGVSSMQIDDCARGFSFQADGALDMRMSAAGTSASDLVNTLSESGLASIFKTYGEERRARAIARRIVARRAENPIATTFELVGVIVSVLGAPKPHKKHPATRVFQALRIAVNGELHELARGLAEAEKILAPRGRIVIVDFHSLEDRIVKKFLRARAGLNPNISRHLPEDKSNFIKPSFQIINRRPVIPGEEEIARNPRARSARLRAASRLDAEAWPFEFGEFGLPEPLGRLR